MFDVVILCDLRFPGGTSTSIAAEIDAAASAGYRVGLAHLDAASLSTDRPIHPALRQRLDDATATLVLPGQRVRSRLVEIRHPMVVARDLGGPLPIDTDMVILVAGQAPRDRDGTVHYDPALVDGHAAAALGVRPVWRPISPVVRKALGSAADRDEIVLGDDWVEIIDPTRWDTQRSGPLDPSRPVIGRHSRPDPLKWPANAEELLAAYPDEAPGPNTIGVRVLGGTAGVTDILGNEPAHWEIHEFGSIDPAAFLASIDVFVYHHHPALVEAFGRTVLEALAAGIPAIAPPSLEVLFGDGCLYATPTQTRELVEDLCRDPVRWRDQADRGRRLVAARFSSEAHLTRLRAVIGKPASSRWRDRRREDRLAPPEVTLIPPGQRAGLPTVLVAALGAAPERLITIIDAVADHRDATGGFVPVVVGTERAPAVAAERGVGFATITNRRNFTEDPAFWPAYAQRRLSQLARSHGATSITVADLDHPDAWIALRVRLDHQDERR